MKKSQINAIWSIALFLSIVVSVPFFYTNCSKAKFGTLSSSSGTDHDHGETDAQGIDADHACESDEIAIGIDRSRHRHPKCVDFEEFEPKTCEDGHVLVYHPGEDRNVCVHVEDYDRGHANCPIGQYISRYTDSGILICSYGELEDEAAQCPVGQYLIGLDGDQPICKEIDEPNPKVCPPGQVLAGINNDHLICTDNRLTNGQFPDISCPEGESLVGINSNAPVCQDLIPTPIDISGSCPDGQFVVGISESNQLICENLPSDDLSAVCPEGSALTEINNGEFKCEPFDQNPAFNGTCPAGKYLAGFRDGEKVCRRFPNIQIPDMTCPNGSYAVGFSEGQLVCAPFPTSGGGDKCVAGTQMLCAVPNGMGVKNCKQDGSGYQNACTPISCSAGFRLKNGVCESIACSPGQSIACPVKNGFGMKTCKNNGTGFKSKCEITGCEVGFRKENGKCVPKTCLPHVQYLCDIPGGFGIRQCNAKGDDYTSACNPLACHRGFRYINGQCVDQRPPRIRIIEKPSNPSTDVNPKFQFNVFDESGIESVMCQLDGGTPVACDSQILYQNLNPGSHQFTVIAKDNSGLTASKSYSWDLLLCDPGTKVLCPIENGYGEAMCSNDGMSQGTCVPKGCDDGYRLRNGVCVMHNANDCDPARIHYMGSANVTSKSGAGVARRSCTPGLSFNTSFRIPALKDGESFEKQGQPNSVLRLRTWKATNCDRTNLHATHKVTCKSGKLKINRVKVSYYSGATDNFTFYGVIDSGNATSVCTKSQQVFTCKGKGSKFKLNESVIKIISQ